MATLDHKAFLASVPADDRARLTETRDGPALRRLAFQMLSVVFLGSWIAQEWPLWWAIVPVQGVLLVSFFMLQHECTHRTPFRTSWLNEASGHLAGVILIQPFEWFRAFHMAHHRFTNDPQNDPELEDSHPRTRRQVLWHLSTLGYWWGKVHVLAQNAFGTPVGDYLTDRLRPRIRREARAMLTVYACVAVFSLMFSPILLWVWLLPLALGFPLLRLYLLAEHDRCPHVTNMFQNTRTTLTTRLVRWLAWNMPYHAEHHAWPTVPFHKLPEVHPMVRAHLGILTPGYGTFTKETLAAARDPKSPAANAAS